MLPRRRKIRKRNEEKWNVLIEKTINRISYLHVNEIYLQQQQNMSKRIIKWRLYDKQWREFNFLFDRWLRAQSFITEHCQIAFNFWKRRKILDDFMKDRRRVCCMKEQICFQLTSIAGTLEHYKADRPALTCSCSSAEHHNPDGPSNYRIAENGRGNFQPLVHGTSKNESTVWNH